MARHSPTLRPRHGAHGRVDPLSTRSTSPLSMCCRIWKRRCVTATRFNGPRCSSAARPLRRLYRCLSKSAPCSRRMRRICDESGRCSATSSDLTSGTHRLTGTGPSQIDGADTSGAACCNEVARAIGPLSTGSASTSLLISASCGKYIVDVTRHAEYSGRTSRSSGLPCVWLRGHRPCADHHQGRPGTAPVALCEV
jgi:hypothetical protein